MDGPRRLVLLALGALLLYGAGARALAQAPTWEAALAAARGQSVFWNAWGGTSASTPTSPGSAPAWPRTTASPCAT